MNSKLTLPKETLHVLATHSRRDGAALAAKPSAHDPKPPSSFTSHWTRAW